MIELVSISRRFGPLVALEDVSLRIAPGRVLGLLGENGAGKSTLMNILFGLLRPSTGQVLINDKPARLSSPRAAQRLGIGMVHQHFKLVPTLSVLDNLALFVRSRRADLRRAADAWLARLKWPLALPAIVDTLTVGQQQRVEILKALLVIENQPKGSRTLILDEPTAVLTPQESEELFAAVRTLREAGTAVVFISHKLAEVRQVCDDVAILRRGKLVHSGPAADLSPELMAERMVGTRVDMPHLTRESSRTPGPAILTLANVSSGKLHNASLSVSRGEIVGIAGVDGNGQSDLLRAILGAAPIQQGSLTLDGHPLTHAPLRTRLAYLACIAEDRQLEALVLPLSIRDNLLLKDYRSEKFSTLGWLRFNAWRRHAQDLIAAFDVRCRSSADPVGRLSGGNQQKVVLARELSDTTKPLVLAVNPTRGLDIGATAFVLNQLLAARARNSGVLLVHSDLDELLAISDRVLVLFNGTLTDSGWPHTTKDAIGRLMLGLSPIAGGAA